MYVIYIYLSLSHSSWVEYKQHPNAPNQMSKNTLDQWHQTKTQTDLCPSYVDASRMFWFDLPFVVPVYFDKSHWKLPIRLDCPTKYGLCFAFRSIELRIVRIVHRFENARVIETKFSDITYDRFIDSLWTDVKSYAVNMAFSVICVWCNRALWFIQDALKRTGAHTLTHW